MIQVRCLNCNGIITDSQCGCGKWMVTTPTVSIIATGQSSVDTGNAADGGVATAHEQALRIGSETEAEVQRERAEEAQRLLTCPACESAVRELADLRARINIISNSLRKAAREIREYRTGGGLSEWVSEQYETIASDIDRALLRKEATKRVTMKFQKKPVIIDAEQWTNRGDSLQRILDLGCMPVFATDGSSDLIISTLEGDMRASENDWIIKGVKGEFYPCKPDIFEATYTPAPSGDQE